MIGLFILFLIISPTLFQIIFGIKAIGEDIKLKYEEVTSISFISHFIFTIFAFKLTAYLMTDKGITCGMPLAGIVTLSILFFIILLVVIVVQHFIKKSYDD